MDRPLPVRAGRPPSGIIRFFTTDDPRRWPDMIEMNLPWRVSIFFFRGGFERFHRSPASFDAQTHAPRRRSDDSRYLLVSTVGRHIPRHCPHEPRDRARAGAHFVSGATRCNTDHAPRRVHAGSVDKLRRQSGVHRSDPSWTLAAANRGGCAHLWRTGVRHRTCPAQ